MKPPSNHDPLAQRLAAWTPAPVGSGRDRILFEAGVAAGQRQARWQMAAILIPLLVSSGGWIWHERTTRHRVELALIELAPASQAPIQPKPTPAPSVEPTVAPGPTSYLVLSQRLGSAGFDPLEPRPEPLAPAPRARVRSILTPISSRRPQDLAEL